MFFLSPLNLWALLGLAVPIAIHLWSKKEGKTIKIGSIRLLQEADSKQLSSIKINEWWLLFLRLLLLTLLVLIIAEPRLDQSEQKVPITYLFEASLLENDEVLRIIDTLEKTNSIKLFEKGFPVIDREQINSEIPETPNYWQLTKELQDLESDSIVVFTNALVSGIKGKRPTIHQNVKWIFLDPGKTEEIALKAISSGDELKILKAVSNSEGINFDTEKASFSNPNIKISRSRDSIYLQNNKTTQAILIEKYVPLKVEFYHNENYSETGFYIEKAFNAISKYLDREIQLHKVQNKDSLKFDNADALVWLSDEIERESRLPILIFEENKLSNSLIIPGSYKNEFVLTSKLNSENIIEAHLAENLIQFLGLNKDLEKEIDKLDKRVMPSEQFIPNKGIVQKSEMFARSKDIAKWFWLLLIPVIVTERLLSKFRKK